MAGKGILLLKSAGIEVECGIMKTECKNLNEAFFKYIQQKQPYITLKIAQTLDGKIAAANGLSRWITNESSRKKVHRLRAEHDAVLVGVNTVIQDDPDLSVRHIRGKHGIRIILDSALRVPLESRVLKNQNIQKTVIATTEQNRKKQI